ncbi:LOW QUALITY PROTEIN: rab3 GTPase-activating protein catalytic subunit [Pleuronectes platessa]|uniref:LOW QUALITY PROTEIN: rab3 GTPase-activating protein catalytic subunit n=1 Tax=Pleuronectes platessa TaxID=8262 RepID=UPI00232A48EF|nr:LOW QUALITY PROTEIN: rab3 GTPase-activating protein catalytic subunit [Pleuronectes platessa]
MAADSEPESEVFEITDFTTASEWERFVSRVEEVLNDWKLIGNSAGNLSLEKGEYTRGTWGEKSQEINFADFKFLITHHFLKKEREKDTGKDKIEEDAFPLAMEDLLCMNNDFPPRAHCLVRWYGIREFVVITPGTNCEAIVSESKCNLLLSSIAISLANSGCQVPIFVQIQQKWRRMYAGECQGPGVCTDFEMVHLRKVPSQYNHLSGLLDIFKSKIDFAVIEKAMLLFSSPFSVDPDDAPPQLQLELIELQCDDECRAKHLQLSLVDFYGQLDKGRFREMRTFAKKMLSLFGSTYLCLQVDSQAINHGGGGGVCINNGVMQEKSDLDPLQAPHWSVRVRTAENPQCLLGDLLTEFLKLSFRKESTEDILGRRLVEDEGKENSDVSTALSKLTEPAATVPISKLSVSNMVHSARKHIRRRRHDDESQLNTDILNSVLLYLFPDAAVERSSENSKNKAAQANSCEKAEQDKTSVCNLFLQLKSAPSDSLTYRLALCVCLANYNYGGLRAVAHLWQEFVLELRYRWENNHLIYGLAVGPPDLRCCLLHQKLQMLNCCIERKRARDEARKVLEANKERECRGSGAYQNSFPLPESTTTASTSTREMSLGKSWDSWSDSEEEFYECLSDQGEVEAPYTEKKKDGSKSKAEGRLHPFNNMTLLNSPDPLYIPLTQEPAPMTEDLLEEQSEVLAKLGTSAEGTHLRARMQSACLLSDMESFKAANPGCVLEDFVRWYSPRDYIEEEEIDEKGNRVVKGDLSARMKIPDNMWAETWETARIIPARRQRRLFDDTKEGEKVLHYLAVQKPADLTHHLLPCILHAAILKLKEEELEEDIPSVKKSIQQATSQASKLLQPHIHDNKKLEDFINQLMTMEAVITQVRSLKAKFAVNEGESEEDTAELEKFVSSLLEEPEVVVSGAGQGPAGSIIHRLFVSAQRLTEFTSDEATLLTPQDEDLGNVRKPNGVSNKVPDFPSPAGREILLRTCVPRPAPYSKALPQRLFCVLLKDEFRLAGAFSSDTSFF